MDSLFQLWNEWEIQEGLLAMDSLFQLWNEWEIQVLVLISFTLQVFLFFAGVLRSRSTNSFLRFSTWISYLGADWVAAYILGFLSRQVVAPTEDGPGTRDPLLTFIWAPFLLVHLGGQDTITAYDTVDSNLWLRHCLNLVLQAALALYVFWKSTLRHDVLLLVTGIFIFVAGIIKYGERTMALKYGTLKSLNSSNSDDDKLLEQKFGNSEEYSDVVGTALIAMPAVRRLFAGEIFYRMHEKYTERLLEISSSREVSFKVLEIELQMMYDDLYTKARVLRTRSGVVFRCISQVCIIVALVLFLVSNKQRYSKADVGITYVLFVGGFCMEVCGAFIIIAVSPWTWLWFKTRECRWLTGVSWHLVSSRIGMPKKRKLWSNQMGQYRATSYFGHYSGGSSSWKQWIMKMIKKGVGKGTLFWFSKVLDTNYVQVDEDIMKAICQGADHLHPYKNYSPRRRNFPNLAQLLELIESPSRTDLGYAILLLHAFTEVHLRKYSAPEATGEIEIEQARHKVDVCRKLSNYMLYLLATNQEMLPVSGSTKQFFASFQGSSKDRNEDDAASFQGSFKDPNDEDAASFQGSFMDCKDEDALINAFNKELTELGLTEPQLCKETLEELRDIWIRLLIYAAGKSRPQVHAGQLAKGGELLTFAWLVMIHCSIGDSGMRRIELSKGVFVQERQVAFVFNLEQSSV